MRPVLLIALGFGLAACDLGAPHDCDLSDNPFYWNHMRALGQHLAQGPDPMILPPPPPSDHPRCPD